MSKKKNNIIKKIRLFLNILFKKFKRIYIKKDVFKLNPIKIFIISLISLVLILFIFKSLIFAAFVNGRPIFRLSILTTAEKQSGTSILGNLIEKELIFIEAKKLGIKITNEEIDSEIANIKDLLSQQDITLEQALELSNQDVETLKEQIRTQKIVEQVLGPKIIIEDTEISDYFTTNKEYFGANSKLDDVKDQIKDQLFNQKLSTEYSSWIEELKVNADIKYLVNY